MRNKKLSFIIAFAMLVTSIFSNVTFVSADISKVGINPGSEVNVSVPYKFRVLTTDSFVAADALANITNADSQVIGFKRGTNGYEEGTSASGVYLNLYYNAGFKTLVNANTPTIKSGSWTNNATGRINFGGTSALTGGSTTDSAIAWEGQPTHAYVYFTPEKDCVLTKIAVASGGDDSAKPTAEPPTPAYWRGLFLKEAAKSANTLTDTAVFKVPEGNSNTDAKVIDLNVNLKGGTKYQLYIVGKGSVNVYGFDLEEIPGGDSSSTETSTQTSTVSSTEASTESSTESSTEASTESSTESSTEASTVATTEASTEATTEPVPGGNGTDHIDGTVHNVNLSTVGATSNIKKGDKFTVKFDITTSGDPISAVDMFVRFDPSVIRPVGAATVENQLTYNVNGRAVKLVSDALIAKQLSVKPASNAYGYVGVADGETSAAALGLLRIAATATDSETKDLVVTNYSTTATLFAIEFEVLVDQTPTEATKIAALPLGTSWCMPVTGQIRQDELNGSEVSVSIEIATETTTETTTQATTQTSTQATTQTSTQATTQTSTQATTQTTTQTSTQTTSQATSQSTSEVTSEATTNEHGMSYKVVAPDHVKASKDAKTFDVVLKLENPKGKRGMVGIEGYLTYNKDLVKPVGGVVAEDALQVEIDDSDDVNYFIPAGLIDKLLKNGSTEAGKVKIVGISADLDPATLAFKPIKESGTLCVIRFEILDAEGDAEAVAKEAKFEFINDVIVLTDEQGEVQTPGISLGVASTTVSVEPYKAATDTKHYHILGDATHDGDITIGDVTRVLNAILDSKVFTDDEMAIFDVTGDGDITIGDVTRILNWILDPNVELRSQKTTKEMTIGDRKFICVEVSAYCGNEKCTDVTE